MEGQHAGNYLWFDKTNRYTLKLVRVWGSLLATLAAQNPHINYISMEREKSIVYKVLDKVKEMGFYKFALFVMTPLN